MYPAIRRIALAVLVTAAPTLASAGCLAGAAIGGVAGHMAGHHGLLGAAAGCAIGHHEEVVKRREARDARDAAAYEARRDQYHKRLLILRT